jgi:hypothetical protein
MVPLREVKECRPTLNVASELGPFDEIGRGNMI